MSIARDPVDAYIDYMKRNFDEKIKHVKTIKERKDKIKKIKLKMKTFTIDKETHEKINIWISEQKKKDDSNYVSGERWTYSFTPGGLGTLLVVRDNILEEEKDFTDYENFG